MRPGSDDQTWIKVCPVFVSFNPVNKSIIIQHHWIKFSIINCIGFEFIKKEKKSDKK